jgi:hypothetical protein
MRPIPQMLAEVGRGASPATHGGEPCPCPAAAPKPLGGGAGIIG